ncbi:MAG: hypothetical protein ABWY20_06095 [Mycobacterium sp.]
MTMTPEEVLAQMREVETSMLKFAEHLKYVPTLPRGAEKERAILMMDYLVPDLAHILASHYISLGWRWHPELAIIKSRPVIGGVLEDLVAYVPADEPDDPIVVEPVPYDPEAKAKEPDMDQLPWRVKPKVTETFEERDD